MKYTGLLYCIRGFPLIKVSTILNSNLESKISLFKFPGNFLEKKIDSILFFLNSCASESDLKRCPEPIISDESTLNAILIF